MATMPQRLVGIYDAIFNGGESMLHKESLQYQIERAGERTWKNKYIIGPWKTAEGKEYFTTPAQQAIYDAQGISRIESRQAAQQELLQQIVNAVSKGVAVEIDYARIEKMMPKAPTNSPLRSPSEHPHRYPGTESGPGSVPHHLRGRGGAIPSRERHPRGRAGLAHRVHGCHPRRGSSLGERCPRGGPRVARTRDPRPRSARRQRLAPETPRRPGPGFQGPARSLNPSRITKVSGPPRGSIFYAYAP